MTKVPQILILMFLTIGVDCICQTTELSDLEFEQEVFYQLFPKLSDTLYFDLRLAPTPPPTSPKYLEEKDLMLKVITTKLDRIMRKQRLIEKN